MLYARNDDNLDMNTMSFETQNIRNPKLEN